MYDKFYKTLFNSGESTCFATTPTGTHVSLATSVNKYCNFFSINPLSKEDSNPTEPWHSTLMGRRADHNVIAYRNFLVEFDKHSLSEQRDIIKMRALPYATLVYSGGKSLHAIIALEGSLYSLIDYKRYAKAIYERMGGPTVVDTSASNPSRLSRCPGALRDGVEQELLDVKGRISLAQLEEWLGACLKEPGAPEPTNSDTGLFRDSTKYFLYFGASQGEWNRRLFLAACDMTRCGCNEEEIVAKCTEVTGHLDSSDRRTIKSAFTSSRRANES